MFRERWRTRQELWYIFKHNFRESFPIIIFAIWFSVVFIASILVWNAWEGDFPNWFATIVGAYIGISGVVVVYFDAKKSQNKMESKILRIEGILSTQFELEKNHPKSLQFYLSLSLNGIIDIFPTLKNLAKKWRKTKDQKEKKFLENKIQYIWKSTIVEYGSILNNPLYISDKLYDEATLSTLKDISNNCDIFPVFDYDENKINFHKFRRIVVYCILLIDELKIDSKFRSDLLKY